jgi:hypothetical protein
MITSGRTTKDLAAAAAGLALLVATLAGCSSDKPDPAQDAPAPAPAASPTGVISPPKLSTVPTLSKEKGIVADTTMTGCTAAKGAVQASGTVKNSGKDSSDLVVVVSWIVPQGSDVVARGVAVVKDAEPGSSHDWKVASDVKVDQQVQCVLSARRGSIKG